MAITKIQSESLNLASLANASKEKILSLTKEIN
jgi:hypothetical protein